MGSMIALSERFAKAYSLFFQVNLGPEHLPNRQYLEGHFFNNKDLCNPNLT